MSDPTPAQEGPDVVDENNSYTVNQWGQKLDKNGNVLTDEPKATEPKKAEPKSADYGRKAR